MSAAVQRSERHGSINWEGGKKVGGGDATSPQRQTGFYTRHP